MVRPCSGADLDPGGGGFFVEPTVFDNVDNRMRIAQEEISDYRRGLLEALVDGAVTSNLLPGAVTAIAARRLARPDSRVAAFIGAGVQARINLDGLTAAGLPIEEVRIVSRSRASAVSFADETASRGIRATLSDNPRAAIDGADVVVTTVPGSPGFEAFLEPSWVAPGSFVSAVDVGRSWKSGFEAYERVVTDDRIQSAAQHADGRLVYGGAFDTDLPELVAGTQPGRTRATDRVVVIHPGNAVGVLAITAEILARLR